MHCMDAQCGYWHTWREAQQLWQSSQWSVPLCHHLFQLSSPTVIKLVHALRTEKCPFSSSKRVSYCLFASIVSSCILSWSSLNMIFFFHFISNRSIRMAAAWEALFLYDCLIFCLTIFKAWRARRDHTITRISIPLISLILRDGKHETTGDAWTAQSNFF